MVSDFRLNVQITQYVYFISWSRIRGVSQYIPEIAQSLKRKVYHTSLLFLEIYRKYKKRNARNNKQAGSGPADEKEGGDSGIMQEKRKVK